MVVSASRFPFIVALPPFEKPQDLPHSKLFFF
jgi:hypothetical protein